MRELALQQLVFRFREARAVLAGLELGLFDRIDAVPRDGASLAAALGVDPRGLGILLNALCRMGIIVRNEAGYASNPGLGAPLHSDADESLRSLWLHDLWHWSRWAKLDQAVRTGSAVPQDGTDPHLGRAEILAGFLSNYTLAMEQSAREYLPLLVEAIAQRTPHRIMDVGGGSGLLLLNALERMPEARGVLIEHEFSLERARQLIDKHPCGARLELRALDAVRDALPPEQDLVVVSRVLMGFPPDAARKLLRNAAASVGRGGTLLVHDFDPATRVGALMSLDMLLNTGGEVHPLAAIADWLQEAGLEIEADRRLTPYSRLLAATRERTDGGDAT